MKRTAIIAALALLAAGAAIVYAGCPTCYELKCADCLKYNGPDGCTEAEGCDDLYTVACSENPKCNWRGWPWNVYDHECEKTKCTCP